MKKARDVIQGRLVLCWVFLALGITALSTSARGDWRFDAETGALYDSNLSNSDRESDQKDDWAWITHASLTHGWQLTRDLRLGIGADLRSELWGQYDSFNSIGGGALATLRYRFGLGAQAPWISLEQRIGYDGFRETGRNNWDELVRLRAGIAVTRRLGLELAYDFENRAAQDDFFDEQSNRVGVRVIYDLTSSLQIALGYSYRQGNVISYAVPARPDIFSIAEVRPEVSTFGTNPRYNAYRLVGQTHAVSIGASYAITRFISMQVSYEYAATLHDPLRYNNHQVQMQLGFAY